MSTPFPANGNYAMDDTLEVLDIGMHANERTATTIDFEATGNDETPTTQALTGQRKPGQLKLLDELYGPLKIGPYTVTRRALDALGATIDGLPLTGHNTHFRTPSRSFVNALQLNYAEIEKRMKVSTFGDDYLLPSLLFELANLRPATAPPVIREGVGASAENNGYANKLARLLNAAQNLDLRLAYSRKRISPSWLIIKNHSMIGASVGIQAFGIFMGIRGIFDAVKKNDRSEIIFNSIGIGTEVASIITDVAVTKAGQHMIEAGSGALKDFIKTRAGIRLSRSGGLVGGALTLPFDIYSAVREFNAASNTTGKAAMDHYVGAGLNIASAAMTVILGTAAMAGFSAAGPVGLAAGALMAIGSQVYGAVRMVDEIDDYIELTVEERWRTGWFSFVPLMDIDQDIKNRYELAKAKIETTKRLQTTARKILDETQRDTVEAVVHGSYEDRLKKKRERVRHWWGVETMPIVYVPEVVGLDDTIDARNGVTAQTPGAVLGVPGENKGIVWMIGSGRDTITGVAKKPNFFYYAEGIKNLTGGDKDDRFIVQHAADDLIGHAESAEFSRLKGGAGSDTLIMDGKQSLPCAGRGYDIDLAAGTLQVYTPNPDATVVDGQTYSLNTLLESIENVQTLQDGRSVVTGTETANVITAKGADTINAGGGDDKIYLLKGNARAFGESGLDFYHVALAEGSVLISEDGVDESYISLGWRMDQIEKWEVSNCRLFIVVNFDFHYGRRSNIAIDNVYKRTDGRRFLQNDKLTIITRDGYHLKPELPGTIDHDNPVKINAEILREGNPEKTTIVHATVCEVPTNQNSNYYVQRYHKHTQFITGRDPDSYYGTRIFLDYDYAEMTSAHAVFATTPSVLMNNAADKDKVNVSCDFLFYFGESLLQIAGFGQYAETTLDAALKKAAANISTHGYMLVFRDGTSHTLVLEEEYAVAPAHYQHSVVANTLTSHDLRFPLRTNPEAVFEIPETPPLKLDHVSACIRPLPIDKQTAIETLEGAGATYHLHLRENRVLRISTPGGLATATTRLNNSSTWEIDATQIKDFNIVLAGNQLYIGTVTLHLPQYEADDLIDQILVIGPEGVVHTVDLAFDQVYISSLDARYFEPPTLADLPEAFSAIAHRELPVRHVALRDGTRGALKYNLTNRKWILDSNKSRDINYSELEVLRRCEHQTKTAPPSLPDH
ncbi:MAG TPA: calcium-binding protein [Pseudomonas sp.]|uniref:calcium-binding protein n=1 Tax=Pseudomonas sp. TaxID=306 RepID=UPI002B634EC4|nr:calcium-binding protein [Pseudomonas sp.]HWH85187.1 calcium-binding protein [Pseudomonas sp.]